MASNVPWEWTQLKTEYGFLESSDESRASCQGQGVTVARPDPADSRAQKRSAKEAQGPDGRCEQRTQP